MEGDRNLLQLGLAPMHSLSITLSHHLVFAKEKWVTLTAWIDESSSAAVVYLIWSITSVGFDITAAWYAHTVAPEDTDMSCQSESDYLQPVFIISGASVINKSCQCVITALNREH